jgi:hypothetical protein
MQARFNLDASTVTTAQRPERRAWHTRRMRAKSGLGAPFAALLASLLGAGCGDEDRTQVNVSGAGGQVGGGGSSGAGGSGGSSGNANAGSSGAGGSGAGGSGGGSAGLCLATDEPFAWPEPRAETVPPDSVWKSDISLPNDAFVSLPLGDILNEVRWVKFTILPTEPDEIYFQDSRRFAFHFDFARDYLPPFQRMTRGDFDAVSLHNDGRQAILGAVLIPGPEATRSEYAVQLASSDDLHPDLVDRVMETVAAHVTSPAGAVGYYFPSSTAVSCLEGKRATFAERGVEVSSMSRWLTGDGCYSPGWAAGRLVRTSAADVDAAYLDGSITADDILLLSGTPPAELPYVAGIVTLEPATPNSHVAILARSYGVPFVYLRDADAAGVQALVGKKVVLSSTAPRGHDPFDLYADSCDVRFTDIDALGPESLAQIRALAVPPAIELAPKQAAGALWRTAEGLVPSDIDRVGGKAAHFGLLRAAAPEATPSPAVALSFDLWDAFMGSPAPNGSSGTLRDEIARRLAPHPWPADLRALDDALDGVRDLIKDAPFPAELAASVREALAGFEPTRRIRFRSSTNVEDSESFTGAGLYDSATGCLADDLDADETGPSLCNPEELEEHGVYRAIQRVYASFYFRNAYFERLRRGVNEAQVGMGVLVHYSVPDAEELANGVATLTVGNFFPAQRADFVSQLGAVSVTNPDGSALPELVNFSRIEAEFDSVSTRQNSSLVPFGGHVLRWEDDYRTLMDLFIRVSDEYALATTKAPPFALDFEYKKVAPGELSLRQVRPLPLAGATADVTPFFLGTRDTLCLEATERTDAFAMHRLKARIQIDGVQASLGAQQLAERLYQSARVEYVDGSAPGLLEGDPGLFPGATHAVESTGSPGGEQGVEGEGAPVPQAEGDEPAEVTVLDAWSAGGGTWTLRTRLRPRVARTENPVYTPAEFFFELSATWDEPVPFLEFSFEGEGGFAPATRSEELVQLWGVCPEEVTTTAELPHVERSFEAPSGVRIDTSYWYPPVPRGPTAGYTAPAFKWERTTISGLSDEPIVLAGYFSQTYRPYHHNFGGEYIFEPRLEPGVSGAALAELAAADIAYIVVMDQFDLPDEIWVAGLDGVLRRL